MTTAPRAAPAAPRPAPRATLLLEAGVTCAVGEGRADDTGCAVEVEELVIVVDELVVVADELIVGVDELVVVVVELIVVVVELIGVAEDCSVEEAVAVESVDGFADGAFRPIVVITDGVPVEVLAVDAHTMHITAAVLFTYLERPKGSLLRSN